QLHDNTQNPGWESVNFVRPAHGLVAMHGSSIIAINALGLNASNTTQGHRFEAKQPVITIKHADNYEQQLLDEGTVIASFATRKAEIVRQLNAAAAKKNLKPIEDDALLDEVTALVERPNVLLGQFEEIYLEVPQECLILTMKANQKYFPLLDANNKLTNQFLIVSNINPADPSAIIGGNERVVRPRLADAKFFFDQDRKKTLESRIAGLDKVVYHNKLGSQGDRAKRVKQIAIEISKTLLNFDNSYTQNISDAAEKAAELAKTDLVTDMVAEFPELQGIMGRYYAQNDSKKDLNLNNDIAFAIEDHYKPRFAGDELPRNTAGLIVALADKLETLIGMFGIGNLPTGDKDPFALRRHALGVIRILMETKLPINLQNLLNQAHNSWITSSGLSTIGVEENLPKFFEERLSIFLKDKVASTQEVDAVLSLNIRFLHEIPLKLTAVNTFTKLPESPALAAANKRVSNILKKVEGEVKAEVNVNLLQERAEIELNKALSIVKPEADKLFERGDYTGSLKALAALKSPVDDFFDNVMVNAEEPKLKANRLGLLAILHQTMNRVADLSKLAN
ncbi:MAG: glycine--tRNA ligase subunit beta, partial [Pseudomonadota bacterium]